MLHCECGNYFEGTLSIAPAPPRPAPPTPVNTLSCPACRQQVSRAAATCPHCGHPFKKPQSLGYIAGMFLIAVILIFVLLDIFRSCNAIDSIK